MLQQDLQLCEGLPVATGLRMVAPQTPEGNLETTPPLHQRWMVARREHGDPVQPGRGRHPTLLIPGDKDPQSLADRCVTETSHPTGLVESRMPGQRARPVREATRRNPPVETLAGRSGSTSLCESRRAVDVSVSGDRPVWAGHRCAGIREAGPGGHPAILHPRPAARAVPD